MIVHYGLPILLILAMISCAAVLIREFRTWKRDRRIINRG